MLTLQSNTFEQEHGMSIQEAAHSGKVDSSVMKLFQKKKTTPLVRDYCYQVVTERLDRFGFSTVDRTRQVYEFLVALDKIQMERKKKVLVLIIGNLQLQPSCS